jgi:hypothetical protein
MTGIGTYLAQNPATVAIVAGEAAFWVFLAVGLVARYPLGMRRFSTVVLVALPVIDLAVLAVTVTDLAHGRTANLSHGLAAVYLGFSIVFGRSMVHWADVRFAHRFAGGPPPPAKPTGREKTRHEWREWGRCVLAAVISAALLLVAIAVIGRPDHVQALWDWLPRLGTIVGIWLVAGPAWQELFGRSEPARPKG